MVTLVGYAVRFPVTHAYVNRLRSPVPGNVWLRMVNSQKRCVTARFHGYARNRVTDYPEKNENLVVDHIETMG